MTAALAADSPARPRAGLRARSRSPRLDGVVAMAPLLAGVAPFGIAIGAAVAERGVDPVAGFATAPMIFGGSAQMTAIHLIDGGASTLVVVATVVAVSARLALFGAALAPHWHDTSWRFRALAAYFIVEPTYAAAAERYERAEAEAVADRQAFYMGAALTLWSGWLVCTAIGILAGGALPDSLGLDAVMPIVLVGMVAPGLRDRPALVAAAVGGLVALPAYGLPHHAGVLVAGVAGIAAATRTEVRR